MLVNTHVYDDPRVMTEARSLAKAGYSVQIIGAARRGDLPVHGAVDGIEIVLAPMVIGKRPSEIMWALWRWLRGDLGTTTESPAQRRSTNISLVFFILWALRLGLGRRMDALHCHDFSPLPAAVLISKLKRVPLIYDAHENAPDLFTGRRAAFVGSVEKRLLPRLTAVLTVGERLAGALRDRGARRVVVVGNWKRLEDYAASPEQIAQVRQQLRLEDYRVIVVYIGTLDPNRDLAPLLTAIEQYPEAALIIAGSGKLQPDVEAAAERASNIRWLGWVDIQSVALYTCAADVVYGCLNPDVADRGSHIYYAAPNKLFEAFAAGKPIIARRGCGEIGAILEQTKAGLLLDEVTPAALLTALQQLQDSDMRARLRQNALAARDQYNWGVAETRLLDLYAELLPADGGRRSR
jgi:glycosyltransferase involved in cell wall biosynthesis